MLSTWWEPQKDWQPWFPIHPEAARAKPGQLVTAIWSNPQHLGSIHHRHRWSCHEHLVGERQILAAMVRDPSGICSHHWLAAL